MVEDILYRIRLGKHYWRSVPFAEMAELYVSRFLRTVSQGMIGLFIVVFLYQKGYSVLAILLLIAGYYFLRALLCFPAAYYIAWAGPKRVTLVSNILLIPSLWALVMIDMYTIASVVAFFAFQAISFSLYYIASDVQFSSINHAASAGKEVGWLHIMEKIGAGIAPMVGGFVAYAFGPERVMWIAAGLSVMSALPLFLSPEKVRRKQRVMFRGFPVRVLLGQFVSGGLVGLDYVVTTAVWSLFVSVAVFGVADDSVYAKLGVVFSISLLASVVTSHVYGVLIDRRRAKELYHAGVVVNAAIHAIRPFITTPVGVAVINAANEVGTSAYNMPYIRNTYESADNLPGYRIVYLSVILAVTCAGASLMALAAALLVQQFGPVEGMKYAFFVGALMTPILIWHGFASLRRQS